MNIMQIEKIRSFNRFYTNILGLLDKHLLESRYTLTEVRIMFEIYNNKLTAKELTGILKFDKGYLSRTLKKLNRLKLIQKTISEKDQRNTYLELSKLGVKEFKILNNASNHQISTTVKNINNDEIKELIKHMNSIEKILTKNKL